MSNLKNPLCNVAIKNAHNYYVWCLVGKAICVGESSLVSVTWMLHSIMQRDRITLTKKATWLILRVVEFEIQLMWNGIHVIHQCLSAQTRNTRSVFGDHYQYWPLAILNWSIISNHKIPTFYYAYEHVQMFSHDHFDQLRPASFGGEKKSSPGLIDSEGLINSKIN